MGLQYRLWSSNTRMQIVVDNTDLLATLPERSEEMYSLWVLFYAADKETAPVVATARTLLQQPVQNGVSDISLEQSGAVCSERCCALVFGQHCFLFLNENRQYHLY